MKTTARHRGAGSAARLQDRKADVAAHWTDTLLVELDRRVASAVTQLRGAGVDPAMNDVVVTDPEVDGLLQRLRHPAAGAAAGSLLAAVQDAPHAEPLLALVQRFALSPFEADALLACLAVDLDRRFERLFGYLNDDLTRTRPTPDLLLRLLAPRASRLLLLAALASDAPLVRWNLLQHEAGDTLRVADGIVRRLLGRPGIDARLARVQDDDDHAPLAPLLWRRRPQAAALAAWAAAPRPHAARLLHLCGRAGSGQRLLLADACTAAGRGLVVLCGRKLRRVAGDVDLLLQTALRDAHAADAVLMLQHADAYAEDADTETALRQALQPWLRAHGGCVVLAAERALPVALWFPAADVTEIELPLPSLAEREADWLAAMAPSAALPSALPSAQRLALAQQLAAKFRTTAGEVASAAQHAAAALRGHTGPDAAAWSRQLHGAAARATAPRLHQLAEALPTRHALSDLVLPADRLDVLADLVRRVRHRRTVLQDWRFDTLSARGRGLVALFHGASGTGKTMAVDAIAHTLQMQLFRIDLAGVVSKYIGETEKNLRAVFDEADRADAVLFFDEADALFGKRSEVKDAHDRYANIEINYLLQRIESFDGIAVLATNKRSHLDEAFLRRIHVALEFPLPRQPERQLLWQRSFPGGAPLAGDIAWGLLARSFELTGGAIRNAALGAAYLAAESGGAIGNRELVNALRAELTKAGRRVQDTEFGTLAPLLTLPATAASMED